MNEVEIPACAKINLSLDVLGKRPDGYHDVEMIMQSIALADRVRVRKGEKETKIRSNLGSIPLNENNIAWKAWALMQERFRLPGAVEIYLHKEIPVAAGLGGGSADAAAVLKAINQLYDLKLTFLDLARLGEKIGADVAFCVWGGTALARGIGELITPLPLLPQLWLVLVNPGFGVSTADVYKHLCLEKITKRPDTLAMIQAIQEANIPGIVSQMVNVLETVTIGLYPEVKKIKDQLLELGLFPLMSGSGPTVFGVAPTRNQAGQAADLMRGKWQTVLVTETV